MPLYNERVGGDPWGTNLASYSMQLNMSTHNKYVLGVWISAILQMFVKLYIEGGGHLSSSKVNTT